MNNQKFNSGVSINGQQSLYLYSILQDINKFKVLLVFLNKGFTWLRELRSFGIYSKIVEETLNEFNNLGFIEIKELSELDNMQFEAFKAVKPDMEHYFKVYFTTNKIFELVEKHQQDFNFIISQNPHLLDFMQKVKLSLKPLILKMAQIEKEETTQFNRKVTLNGVTFEKSTIMSKEVKQFLKLTASKTGTALILQEIKPLALMTENERKKHINKIFINGKEVNQNSIREIEEYNRQAEEDFKTGSFGLSDVEVDIIAENRQKQLLLSLGIENE